jgi:hypothetical protein
MPAAPKQRNTESPTALQQLHEQLQLDQWRSIIPVSPLSINPPAPLLPLWIIAMVQLFWCNVVPQAGRAIGYNQKSPRNRALSLWNG